MVIKEVLGNIFAEVFEKPNINSLLNWPGVLVGNFLLMISLLMLFYSSDAIMHSLTSTLYAYVENKQHAFPTVWKFSSR